MLLPVPAAFAVLLAAAGVAAGLPSVPLCDETDTQLLGPPTSNFAICTTLGPTCANDVCVPRACLGAGVSDTLALMLWVTCDLWPLPPT